MFRRLRPTVRPDVPAPAPSVVPNDPVRSAIAQRMAAVEAELTEAAGSASLCSLSRSGGRVDGVKHLEGRMAALMECRRHVAGADEPARELDAISSRWRWELEASRTNDRGPSWIAYHAGGVDELEALVAHIG